MTWQTTFDLLPTKRIGCRWWGFYIREGDLDRPRFSVRFIKHRFWNVLSKVLTLQFIETMSRLLNPLPLVSRGQVSCETWLPSRHRGGWDMDDILLCPVLHILSTFQCVSKYPSLKMIEGKGSAGQHQTGWLKDLMFRGWLQTFRSLIPIYDMVTMTKSMSATKYILHHCNMV